MIYVRLQDKKFKAEFIKGYEIKIKEEVKIKYSYQGQGLKIVCLRLMEEEFFLYWVLGYC